jgi:hypothetical protein
LILDAFARTLKNPKTLLVSACAQELKSVQHWYDKEIKVFFKKICNPFALSNHSK